MVKCTKKNICTHASTLCALNPCHVHFKCYFSHYFRDISPLEKHTHELVVILTRIKAVYSDWLIIWMVDIKKNLYTQKIRITNNMPIFRWILVSVELWETFLDEFRNNYFMIFVGHFAHKPNINQTTSKLWILRIEITISFYHFIYITINQKHAVF